jgi:hypothetical protein
MTTQNLYEAYKKGWLAAARWANRDDLAADIGSVAYNADMYAALESELRRLAAIESSVQAGERLTDAEILELAEPYGAFEYGDAQGHKRKDFARAIESEVLRRVQGDRKPNAKPAVGDDAKVYQAMAERYTQPQPSAPEGEREAFEAWFSGLEEAPWYDGIQRAIAWNAWQAARATQPAAEAVPKCAQCKKEYKPGKTSVGCPKCAPGVRVSEAEFQKPIRSRQQGGAA